jgi:DNA-binding CsgD family transcriptional regulator
MRAWTNADEEAFARSVLRRRWLNALRRGGVLTVGQLRAVAEEQLLEIPQLGPQAVADVSAALADPRLRSEDSIELLGLPQAPVISERDQELVRMRQRGATIAAIARRFGISPERVRQILDRDGW